MSCDQQRRALTPPHRPRTSPALLEKLVLCVAPLDDLCLGSNRAAWPDRPPHSCSSATSFANTVRSSTRLIVREIAALPSSRIARCSRAPCSSRYPAATASSYTVLPALR